MASTLDNISNGRLELGMGAEWHEEEYVAYGFPFLKLRRARIGGIGEKLTLKVVAELADGYNVGASTQDFAQKMKILKKHCKRVNRDFNAIQKSWVGEVIIDEDDGALARKIEALKPKQTSFEEYLKPRIVGSPEDCLEKISQYVCEGATLFILLFRKYREDKRIFMQKVVSKVGRIR